MNQVDCSNIKKIQDISNQVDYIDKQRGKTKDARWVSCGQDKDYSELNDKYKKHFGIFDEKIIAKLMCKCCKLLKPKGKEKVTWLEFYQCMKSNSTEYSQFLKSILDELIEKHK